MYTEKKQVMEKVFKLIGGKWNSSILCIINKHGPIRFGELKRKVPGISQRVLTSSLKAFEKAELIEREDFGGVPPKVEYRITKKGEELKEISYAVFRFGAKFEKLKLYARDRE